MDRINGADTVDIGSGRRGFRDENLVAGVAGTEVTADFLNAIQEEIMKVVTAAGLDPSASDWTQLWQALQVHGLSTVNRSRQWLAVTSMTVSSPPASPASGDTYLIPSGASGVWAANVGKIVQWTGSAWSYLTPPDGHGISLPDGRIFERISGAYVEFLASRDWAASRTAAVTKLGRLPWLPVLSMTLSSPPGSPAVGDTYLVPSGASGVWAANVGNVAEWTGSAWSYLTPPDGHAISLPNGRIFERVSGAYTELLSSESRAGLVKLATIALAIAGADTSTAVTPAGLAATLSSIVPPRPNLCPNGGFEDGIANIVVTKSGGGTWPSTINTNSWGRSLYLTGAITDGTYLITWPSFPVDAGVTYTISGDAVLLATSGTVRYQIVWLNSSGATISTSTGPARGPADFSDSNARRQAMAGAFVAPTGTVKAQLQCVFDTVVSATAIFARLAKVETGALPATAYTPPPPGSQNVMQAYSVAGTYSWVCPVGVTRVKAIVTGGGGGGARCAASQSGASGGAGGTAVGFVVVTPGASYTVIVGAGGIGGNWGTGGNEAGNNGGSSSALGLTGNGGGGAQSISNNGNGGTATGGVVNIPGGDGQDALVGSSAYSTNGGASYWGGGPSSATVDGGKSSRPGTGGSSAYGGSALAGGAGADGIVVLEY